MQYPNPTQPNQPGPAARRATLVFADLPIYSIQLHVIIPHHQHHHFASFVSFSIIFHYKDCQQRNYLLPTCQHIALFEQTNSLVELVEKTELHHQPPQCLLSKRVKTSSSAVLVARNSTYLQISPSKHVESVM